MAKKNFSLKDVYPEMTGNMVTEMHKENETLNARMTDLKRRIDQLKMLNNPVPVKLEKELKSIPKKLSSNAKVLADLNKKRYSRTK